MRTTAGSRSLLTLLGPPVSRSIVGCATFLAVVVAPETPTVAACAGCGTVRGSVTVEQAAVRTDGPKHDLDVIVILDRIDGDDPPPVSARAEMDQQGLVFIPHVLAIQRGTTVTFLNNDNDEHNVYFLDDRTGETLDIGTWGRGVSVDHTFDREGMVITMCKLHLEMAAYIVVVSGPWFVQTRLDEEGRHCDFAIENVPPGEYELTVWHKKLKQKGGPARITVGAGATVDVGSVITKAKYARASG
jgi:plastocyanin